MKTFIVDSLGGISGSLTQLVDGSSYLIAGSGVSITSQSNGSVLIEGNSNSTSSYGNGSDGSVVISGSTTLSRDMYYSTLTVQSGQTLFSNGYRIFVQNLCTISGTVACDGGNGSNGGGGNPGPGGVGGPAGTLGGGSTGGSNSDGVASTNGVLGANARGGDGSGTSFHGGSYVPFWNMTSMGDVVPVAVQDLVHASAGSSLPITGGAGGGSGAQGSGGGGGGVIALIAHDLIVASGGSIHANGGQNDPNGWGGGGAGGLILIVTANVLQNSGSIAVAGGSGVQNGTVGVVRTFILD
jgi:hypothetical protein